MELPRCLPGQWQHNEQAQSDQQALSQGLDLQETEAKHGPCSPFTLETLKHWENSHALASCKSYEQVGFIIMVVNIILKVKLVTFNKKDL